MANQQNSSVDKVALGGYVLEDCDGTPELILIGTGTELDLCVQAAKKLTKEGRKVRVVSMPCVELFEEQSDSYKEEVLPSNIRKRLVVEAAESFGWHKYIGLDGDSVTMNSFGASAPGGLCMEKFGFTVENVVEKSKNLLNKVYEWGTKDSYLEFISLAFRTLYFQNQVLLEQSFKNQGRSDKEATASAQAVLYGMLNPYLKRFQ